MKTEETISSATIVYTFVRIHGRHYILNKITLRNGAVVRVGDIVVDRVEYDRVSKLKRSYFSYLDKLGRKIKKSGGCGCGKK